MENLKHLVRQLTGNYLQVAVSNQSFFINDIADNLPVDNNSQGLFPSSAACLLLQPVN